MVPPNSANGKIWGIRWTLTRIRRMPPDFPARLMQVRLVLHFSRYEPMKLDPEAGKWPLAMAGRHGIRAASQRRKEAPGLGEA